MPTISSKPPTEPAPPVAIVYEKRSRWAPELERQFEKEDVRVIACRSFGDVIARSAETPRGAILIDLGAGAGATDCLRFLGRRAASPFALPVLVVGSEQTADLEWPVRDLGATAFFATQVAGHQMAALCRRQWSNTL